MSRRRAVRAGGVEVPARRQLSLLPRSFSSPSSLPPRALPPFAPSALGEAGSRDRAWLRLGSKSTTVPAVVRYSSQPTAVAAGGVELRDLRRAARKRAPCDPLDKTQVLGLYLYIYIRPRMGCSTRFDRGSLLSLTRASDERKIERNTHRPTQPNLPNVGCTLSSQRTVN